MKIQWNGGIADDEDGQDCPRCDGRGDADCKGCGGEGYV